MVCIVRRHASRWCGLLCATCSAHNVVYGGCLVARRMPVLYVIVSCRTDTSCGNAGRWEEALQLVNKVEVLAQKGGGVPMSTTLYNFAIDTVRARVLFPLSRCPRGRPFDERVEGPKSRPGQGCPEVFARWCCCVASAYISTQSFNPRAVLTCAANAGAKLACSRLCVEKNGTNSRRLFLREVASSGHMRDHSVVRSVGVFA